MFRDTFLLGARLIVGGYVAAHGAQKLFGSFGGHGIEGTGGFFESVGLAPGKPMAVAAGTSELAGGALTAAGLAHPLGPAAVASTMAVASGTVHVDQGAFAADNGPELPLANLGACLALAAVGPGRFSVDALTGTRVPGRAVAAAFGAGALAAAGLMVRAAVGRNDDEEEDEVTPDAGPTDEADVDPVGERRSA